MQKERVATAPIAIRPKTAVNQLFLIQAPASTIACSGKGLPSQQVTIGNIGVGGSDDKRKSIQFAYRPQGLHTAVVGPHSAPSRANPLQVAVAYADGTVDNLNTLPINPINSHDRFHQQLLQQQKHHGHATTLRSSLLNNVSLASSYQSSEDNDSLYTDADDHFDFGDETGNVTATPDIEEEEEDTLDRINPSIDLSNFPQFQIFQIPDNQNQLIPSPQSIPFSTSCPESLVRNRGPDHTHEIGPVPEKDVKERIKKDNHNKVERRRRYHINDRIQELGALLPRKEEMKINKGNILKTACEYVRGARQLEDEYRLVAVKVQDFEKVSHCLVQRIQELENRCNQLGGANACPKQTSDQEVAMQAVLSGQLFSGLSLTPAGLLTTNSHHQNRSPAYNHVKPATPEAFSPFNSQTRVLASRVPSITTPMSSDQNNQSGTNSELLQLLSGAPVGVNVLKPSVVPQEAWISDSRKVPSISVPSNRPHHYVTSVPVRAVSPHPSKTSRRLQEDIKPEPLTPNPASMDFCSGQPNQAGSVYDCVKPSASPDVSPRSQGYCSGRNLPRSSPLATTQGNQVPMYDASCSDIQTKNDTGVVMDFDMIAGDVLFEPFNNEGSYETPSCNTSTQNRFNLTSAVTSNNENLPGQSQGHFQQQTSSDDPQFDFDISMANF